VQNSKYRVPNTKTETKISLFISTFMFYCLMAWCQSMSQ